MTISICNGKGGSGKTTVAMLIALAWQGSSKRRVGLLDLDPQQTATQWVGVTGAPVAIAKPGESYDVLLIDTPPRLESRELVGAIKQADRVVLVTSPSPTDLFTSRTTAEAIKREGAAGKARILFNKVKPRTRLSRDLDDLAERIGLPSLKSYLHDRQGYQHAALDGWSALTPEMEREVFAVAMELNG